jgi:hypothetical protein
MNECKVCSYGKPYRDGYVICERFPQDVKKHLDDTCGEYKVSARVEPMPPESPVIEHTMPSSKKAKHVR